MEHFASDHFTDFASQYCRQDSLASVKLEKITEKETTQEQKETIQHVISKHRHTGYLNEPSFFKNTLMHGILIN